MEKNMRIGLDFDGVIADIWSLKQRALKSLFGIAMPKYLMRTDHLVKKGVITASQAYLLRQTIYENSDFGLKEVPDAFFYIEKLLMAGHEIEVITCRYGSSLSIAKNWLSECGFVFPVISVGFDGSKVEAAKDFDVYVDDDLGKISPLVGIGPRLFFYLWPYNVESINRGLIPVSSWFGLHDHLIERD